jgi:hypothetical protein
MEEYFKNLIVDEGKKLKMALNDYSSGLDWN